MVKLVSHFNLLYKKMINENKQIEIYDLIGDREWIEVMHEIEGGFPLDIVLLDDDTVFGLIYAKYFSDCYRREFINPDLRNLVIKILTDSVELNDLNIDLIDVYGSIFTTDLNDTCLLYTSPSPRDKRQSRMPSSA